MAKVITVTDENFEAEVLKSDIPVLVDFTASWCGPCKALSPILDELAAETEKVKIVKIDVGGNPETKQATNPLTAEKYGISVFPTTYLFRGEKIAAYAFGASDKDTIAEWINQSLAKPAANDQDAETVKENSIAEIREAQAEAMKEMAHKLGKYIGIPMNGIVFASGLTLAAVSTGGTLPAIFGLAAAGLAAVDCTRLMEDKSALAMSFGKAASKVLSPIDSSIKLGTGIMLFAAASAATGLVPTLGLGVLALGMTALGGMGVIGSVANIFTKTTAPETQAKEKVPETSPEAECKDGVCELPDQSQNGPSI